MSGEQQDAQSNYYGNEEEQVQPFETSLLFEPFALWVLAVLLLAAIWFKFIPLIVVSTFLFLLFLSITIWKKVALSSVKPTLSLNKSRLFAGEEFQIQAAIYNEKWLPLIWLEWIFPKSTGISLGESKENTHIIRFLWLLWFQKVNWTLNGKALRRGVYNLGQITLRSGDGFRFTEIEQAVSLDGTLYIYPKLVPVNVPKFRPLMQWGIKGKKGGFIEDPLLINGIREYQAGDELRRFNWRASARTGKLQTNVYQPVVTEQLVIYIDVQGFVINERAYEDFIRQQEYMHKKREAFEWFLSIIASVAVKYKEQEISIGFASNGLTYNEKRMSSILPSTNLTPLLDQLAKITQCLGTKRMAPLERMLQKGQLKLPVFIFCHRVTESHYLWYQQNKHKLAELCFYYNEENQYSQKLAVIAKSMNTFLQH